MQSDGVIVARVLGGDREAYRILVERYQERCIGYASHVLQDADEADDVTQEAFVRAYRALDQCANPERFKAWLFQILVNRVRSAMEKRSTRARWIVRADVDVRVDSIAAETRSPGQGDRVDDVLWVLAPAQREALMLKYVEGATYDEMARMTGSSVPALKMRVSRACEILRAKMLAKR